MGQSIGGYPTEKPVELIEVLIEQSSSPGEIVGDPFLGSGASGVAAIKKGRDFTGCDIQQESADNARLRIQGVCDGQEA